MAAFHNCGSYFEDLNVAGCVTIVATFKPTITYKVSKSSTQSKED